MRRTIFVALSYILCSVTHPLDGQESARRFHTGVYATGFGTTVLHFDKLAESEFRPGVAIAIVGHHDLGARFQLRMGGGLSWYQAHAIDYSPLFGSDGADPLRSYLVNETDFLQVIIPVSIRYKLTDAARHLYLACGLQPEFVINADIHTQIREYPLPPLETGTEPFYEARNTGLAGHMEFGHEWPAGNHKLNLSLGLSYGFRSIYNAKLHSDAFANVPKGHRLVAGVQLGYIF